MTTPEKKRKRVAAVEDEADSKRRRVDVEATEKERKGHDKLKPQVAGAQGIVNDELLDKKKKKEKKEKSQERQEEAAEEVDGEKKTKKEKKAKKSKSEESEEEDRMEVDIEEGQSKKVKKVKEEGLESKSSEEKKAKKDKKRKREAEAGASEESPTSKPKASNKEKETDKVAEDEAKIEAPTEEIEITEEMKAALKLPAAAAPKKRKAHIKMQNVNEDEIAEAKEEAKQSRLVQEQVLVEDVGESDDSSQEDGQESSSVAGGKLKSNRQRRKKDPKLMPSWMKDFTLIEKEEVTLKDFAAKHNIPQTVTSNLEKMGIKGLFGVQVSVVPKILKAYITGGDSLVRAPTGSGKTLAYAIPIVTLLSNRNITRLRALVVVPTKDLAQQVLAVFQKLTEGTGLKVAAVSGDRSLKKEQTDLVGESTLVLNGGQSLIDILISTPGRLIDHIDNTPNFTLQHLRFLVVDEADRLLMQSYHEWLPKLTAAMEAVPTPRITLDEFGCPIYDVVAKKVPVEDRGYQYVEPKLQKLLFSATLTTNPKKIASLNLVNPQFFSSSEQYLYKIPATLKQHLVVCKLDNKPLVLLHFLMDKIAESTQLICFASSVEATHRLYILLNIMMEALGVKWSIVEFSGTLSPLERSTILEKFKKGKIRALICSDVVSRGLDLKDVGAVINYDVPAYINTYVHRVGRTARAGKAGVCYTLTRPEEVHHFKDILLKAENAEQQRVKTDPARVAELLPHYETALSALEKIVQGEQGLVK